LILQWLKHYRRGQLAGDLSAGVIVAVMMIPQGLAYALVAGLPPVVGIYASIVPPLLYAVFGTSSTQSIGPTAITSLMTASLLAPLAAPGSALYGVLAAQLALMAGVVLVLCGLARIGFLASFFSRPVMSGFSFGSALVIAGGQLPALLGGPLTRVHWPSAALGLGSLAMLVLSRRYGAGVLRLLRLSPNAAEMGARLAPMLVVALGVALVAAFDLAAAGVRITGAVPGGLPPLNLASSGEHWRPLLQPALLTGFMVFLISMSGAQALALKRAEKLRSNYELVGLGASNIASALTGALPVTGSISRSAINFAAGANTQLASVISAVLLALALVAPTGWLALLPLPTLAATIIVAVLGMPELATLRTAWRYDRADALALLACGAGVVLLGIEAGVLVGVGLSIGTLLWRASRPHMAVLGRIAGTEHFRNIERYPAATASGLLLVRVDGDLFFGNVEAVGERLEEALAVVPAARHLVLVLSAVNAIDTSALFELRDWNQMLRQRGIALHLAEVKGPVMDRLRNSDLFGQLSGQVFLSTAMAWEALGSDAAGIAHGR
jgi:SulP family sulfate permease